MIVSQNQPAVTPQHVALPNTTAQESASRRTSRPAIASHGDIRLAHTAGSGPPLDELLRWTANDDYEPLRPRLTLPTPIEQASYRATNARELGWQDGPGPTYDVAAASDAIRRRYDRVCELISYTLAELRSNTSFHATIDELRRRGWLDWHILNSVTNAASSHRLQMLGLDRYLNASGPKGDEARTAFRLFTTEPETKVLGAAPIEAFSIENLELQRVFGLVVFVKHVGLNVHQRTPDLPAIEDFLDVRYRYWTDDVPHRDPFV